jgi:hypothetical protein
MVFQGLPDFASSVPQRDGSNTNWEIMTLENPTTLGFLKILL